MRRISIRVDGSAQIGLGHLVRCIALAQMLKDEFEIKFFSREIPEKVVDEILIQGFAVSRIQTEEEFIDMLTGSDIVVLDNYFFESAYQNKIKEKAAKLVCIDDLYDKEFFADLIINQIPGTRPEYYKAQNYTQFALGPEYAVLRDSFLKAAARPEKSGNIDTVLICFGGADNRNLTTQSLQVILQEPRFKKVIVVTGVSYNYLEELFEEVKRDNRVEHYHGVDENKMVELMQRAGLAVVPASGILLEALAIGCRIISGAYVDNQAYVYEAYTKTGYVEPAGNFSGADLSHAIQQVLSKPDSPKKFIDGLSGQRIRKLFRQLQLEDEILLRPATEADLQKTFEWAGDREIRKYSFSQDEISFEGHSHWFLNKIKSNACCYLVAEMNNELIGSIRFDIKDEEAIISYLVDTRYHSRGIGIILLKKGLQEFVSRCKAGVSFIVGFVIPENIASVRAFEKLGYTRLEEESRIKFIKPVKLET